MVLDDQRKNVDPILTSIAKRFVDVNPDIFTCASIIFAFLAGLFFYFSSPSLELNNHYLYFAVIFVFLNGFFDAIDGKVAKLANKTSVRGDFLDHAIDRYADVFMVGGLALSPWCRYPSLGFLAIVGMLLTSYMGTQAQAVGYKRDYSGLLGRADRLVLLIIFPILQHLFLHDSSLRILGGLYLLEWVLFYFAVIGNTTAAQRFFGTLTWFKENNYKK